MVELAGSRVLVTDGHQRSALAVVRSLGRAGCQCVVGAPFFPSIAGASRYCAAEVSLDMAVPEEGVGRLRALVREHAVDVVIPVSDHAMTALGFMEVEDEVEGARIAAPQPAAYRALSDKVQLLEHARQVGIAVPESIVVEYPQDIVSAAERIGYPCVIKPHLSVVIQDGEARDFSVSFASDREQAARVADDTDAGAFPLLVQERVTGPGEGVFLLFDGRRVRAGFGHRRLRELPPSGGASTYRESVAVDPELLEVSRKLLSEVGWEGVGMVEFKRCARTGRAYVMEVNGRFWGSLQLAVDAGVDFPKLLVEMALGAPAAPAPEYRTGVRTRWFWGDVDYLLTRLREDSDELHLPEDEKGRSRGSILVDVLRFRPGEKIEELRLRDPSPFFLGLRCWVGRLWRKLFGR